MRPGGVHDFYSILAVSPDATDEQLRVAYEQQLEHWDPRRNHSADAVQTYEAVRFAYQVLSNPEKRALYDRWSGYDEERAAAAAPAAEVAAPSPPQPAVPAPASAVPYPPAPTPAQQERPPTAPAAEVAAPSPPQPAIPGAAPPVPYPPPPAPAQQERPPPAPAEPVPVSTANGDAGVPSFRELLAARPARRFRTLRLVAALPVSVLAVALLVFVVNTGFERTKDVFSSAVRSGKPAASPAPAASTTTSPAPTPPPLLAIDPKTAALDASQVDPAYRLVSSGPAQFGSTPATAARSWDVVYQRQTGADPSTYRAVESMVIVFGSADEAARQLSLQSAAENAKRAVALPGITGFGPQVTVWSENVEGRPNFSVVRVVWIDRNLLAEVSVLADKSAAPDLEAGRLANMQRERIASLGG
jgi:hypothetical protein